MPSGSKSRRPAPWLVFAGCLGLLAALLAGPLPGGRLAVLLPLGLVAALVGQRWWRPGRLAGRPAPEGTVRHLQRLRLGQGNELHLVVVAGRHLLLASAPGRVRVLERWRQSPEPAAGTARAASRT